MLVGYPHVIGTPENNRVEQCAALFNPGAPPPLPGHVPVPAAEGAVLPSWDDTNKNYARAHAVIDHYTRIYPALVALREDTDLNTVARTAVSSEEPAERLTAMQVMSKALNETRGNIDKTYGLVDDPKSEFVLELQPVHEQLFLSDPTWKSPFRQMIARASIKEHGNVEFWNTIGVSAVGLALFAVAELSSGGLATFFFAAAAGGSIAQSAASWDKYFTSKAAAGANLSQETALITREQASGQLLTAALDTVMAFVDVYTAAAGGVKALSKAGEAESRFAGVAEKEAASLEQRGLHTDIELTLEEESKTLKQKVRDPENIGDVLDEELRKQYDAEIRVGEHTYYHKPDGIWCRASGVAFCGYSFGKEVEDALAKVRQTRRPSLSGKETEAAVQEFLGSGYKGQVSYLGGRQVKGVKFGMSIADFARGGKRLRIAEVKNIDIEINIATGFADLRDQVGKYLVNIPGSEKAELLLFLDIRGQRLPAGGLKQIVESVQRGTGEVFNHIYLITEVGFFVY
jgi:hypothetical protein